MGDTCEIEHTMCSNEQNSPAGTIVKLIVRKEG